MENRYYKPMALKPSILRCAALLLAPVMELHAAEENITWLLQYDAASLPSHQGWHAVGSLGANATVVNGALRIQDDSATESGAFRAAWKYDSASEIVIETRVRVGSVTAWRGTSMFWPAQEGVPIGLLVSDGRHEGGLLLRPEKIGDFHDRVALFDAKSDFHTYQIVICGRDMSIAVDGVVKIRGEGAFWKPTQSGEAFVQFGSNSTGWMGESFWSSVKLGVRKTQAVPKKSKLRVTIGEPWEIPSTPGGEQPLVGAVPAQALVAGTGKAVPPPKPARVPHHTRPYLYEMGRGLLILSVAQGADALYEPYGVLRSTDEGRTWQPVKNMQFKTFASQPHLRLPDGDILGISRWNVKYLPGLYVGMNYRFDPKAEKFEMSENLIHTPIEAGQVIVFDRDIFNFGNGEVMAVVYTRAADRKEVTYMLNSKDAGATWHYYSTIGVGPEPSVVRFSDTEMMALLRTLSFSPLLQTWSHDGGKTWTPPVTLEEGSVSPDMVYMSNGVVACSYGRPGVNLMLSTDRGKTWEHHVITDSKGFNYTALREVRPGRLLFVHDSPNMRALHVEVERVE